MELMEPEEVAIRFSCLKEHHITADLYILLHWKYHGNYRLPLPIVDSLLDDKFAVEYLQEQGFIKLTTEDDYNQFELRQKAINLFKPDTPEQKWLEFLGTFPMKVPSDNGGSRPLKVAKPDSKANDKPKAKYIALLKRDPAMHEYIMSVLKAEMEMRRTSNSFKYMSALDAWLNQASYDKYAYLLDEQQEKEDEGTGYGQTMV